MQQVQYKSTTSKWLLSIMFQIEIDLILLNIVFGLKHTKNKLKSNMKGKIGDWLTFRYYVYTDTTT